MSSSIVDSESSQSPSAASPERSGGHGARSPFPDFVPDINRMYKLLQTVCREGLEIRGARVPTQKIAVSPIPLTPFYEAL